jgi:glycosyltransferase involved in cell wall biosynthesis
VKVALVIGRCPPGICGVGDYTAKLRDALLARGVGAQLIVSDDWRLRSAWEVRNCLRDYDIVHIQYPTLGFGYRLGPQALSLLRSCVVTIHEASQRQVLRKLSVVPFLMRPRHVIFTSDYERQYVAGWVPWIRARSSIAPVPSSIPVFPGEQVRNTNEIVYFGLILPRKGLEEVIEVARLIQAQGLHWQVRIIGNLRPERREYFDKLKAETAVLPVIWDLNRSGEEVAEKLAGLAVAYLPFPDGASERRTSLKAVLANGVATVTTAGPHTPEVMAGFVKFAETPREALRTVSCLLQNGAERDVMARKATHFLQECSWERVADLHEVVYRDVLCPDDHVKTNTKEAEQEL